VIHLLEGLAHQRRVFAVDNQNFGAAMLERKRHTRRIEPGIQRIEHCAEHRHRKMGLNHLGNVRCDNRNRVKPANPELRQCGSQPHASLEQLPVGETAFAVDHRDLVRESARGTRRKANRRQRHIIGRVLVEAGLERVHGHALPRIVAAPTGALSKDLYVRAQFIAA
jgi:hypothetical protein